MTILLTVKTALAGDSEAPENMGQLLALCQDDLTVEELETAKSKFPSAFAVLEQPSEFAISGDPAVGTTIETEKPLTEASNSTETVTSQKPVKVVEQKSAKK